MFSRVAGVCLTLAVVSIAQAGALVELVPDHAGPYVAGESVVYDVMLSQTDVGSGDKLLRYVQFDFSGTDTELNPALPITFAPVRFWETSGAGHFIEDDLAGTRPNVVSLAYYFTDFTDLGPNAGAQVNLLGNGSPIKIGEVQVMSSVEGTFTLDLMNAGESNADVGGADVRFGFEITTGVDVLTTWRANTGELTGGVAAVVYVGDPPVCDTNLASADPVADKELWRSANNIARLTFDAAITAPAPGDIVVHELIAGGTFGADLAASFTFTVDPGDDHVLIVQEDGSVLQHAHWYGIESAGWDDVCAFEIDYEVAVGDANGDGFVLNTDVGQINTSISCFSGCNPRHDINGDGFVLNTDVGVTNTSISYFGTAKPAGH